LLVYFFVGLLFFVTPFKNERYLIFFRTNAASENQYYCLLLVAGSSQESIIFDL